MKRQLPAALDSRDAPQLAAELLARAPGFLAAWRPAAGVDQTLPWIVARYVQAIIQRLNQAPEKHKLAFLESCGIQLIPAQPSRAPMVFQLADNAADGRVPSATRLMAQPPPERNEQIFFETERATGLAAAKIKEVVSLWPGRDQYIDHSADFLAGRAFIPFSKRQLRDTPHVLYLAHDTLLALAGSSNVGVAFELTTPGNEPLSIVWEYWDGQVWREFLAMRPSCDPDEAREREGTLGLTRSGTVRLTADCAETAKRTVNNIEGFWIRGRLEEPLPLDPRQILPEADSITLETEIQRPLAFTVAGPQRSPRTTADCAVTVMVTDEGGKPLPATVTLIDGNPSVDATEEEAGLYCFNSVTYNEQTKRIDVVLDVPGAPAITESLELVINDASTAYRIDFLLSGFPPDQAFADQTSLDVSSTFFPFGPQPLPGNAFYFTSEEVFSKPGANVTLLLVRAPTPQDEEVATAAPVGVPEGGGPLLQVAQNELSHLVAWEYWNGRRWVTLFTSTNNNSPARDLNRTETIHFVVPLDMAKSTINDTEGFWMRARLVSGGYGHTTTVVTNPRTGDTLTVLIMQPPALADFRLGYSWLFGPLHPQRVLTFNDFQYEDRTEETRWPGQTFQPFRPVRDVTPALYLGFDRKLPVDRLGLFFDVEEQRGDTQGPQLVWQYFDGVGWQDLAVEDETRRFRVPGIVSFIGPQDSQLLARFNAPLHWVRARLKEDGPPGEPRVSALFSNATWAVQRQTITDEPLGASTGEPNQVFISRQIPVLEGERVEVRELAGPRANVEWRIVAMEIFKGDVGALQQLETMLAREGLQVDIEKGDLRLRRDRLKRVTEVWVRWIGRRHLFRSGPNDREYVAERTEGRYLFGDGIRGKIPPLGAAIAVRLYKTGGGSVGNVKRGAINQVAGALGGLEHVFNARPAEGGADAEPIERVGSRGPRTLRHRGRALTLEDYETLAREASPAVAVVHAISGRDGSGRTAPGWVTIFIIPSSDERRPWPSFGLREHIRRFIEKRAPADLAAAGRIQVTGPEYVSVEVDASIVPLDASEAGAVELRARAALESFLHPLTGGPYHRGWTLGRDVFISDVASVIEAVEGVDYVQELALLRNRELQGDRVVIADDRTVVAGDIRLKLLLGEETAV